MKNRKYLFFEVNMINENKEADSIGRCGFKAFVSFVIVQIAYEARYWKLLGSVRKRNDVFSRIGNGRFTNSIGTNKIKLNKTTTTVVKSKAVHGSPELLPGSDAAAGVEIKPRKTYLNTVIPAQRQCRIERGGSPMAMKPSSGPNEGFIWSG